MKNHMEYIPGEDAAAAIAPIDEDPRTTEELLLAQDAAAKVTGIADPQSEEEADELDRATSNIYAYVKNKFGEVSEKTLGEVANDLSTVARASVDELEALIGGKPENFLTNLMKSRNLLIVAIALIGGYFLLRQSVNIIKIALVALAGYVVYQLINQTKQ